MILINEVVETIICQFVLDYHFSIEKFGLKVKGFDSNSEYLVEKLDEELQELILKIKEKLKTINLVKNDENICSQDINKEKISKLIEEL